MRRRAYKNKIDVESRRIEQKDIEIRERRLGSMRMKEKRSADKP
jgi:hypothetical protein